MRTATKNASSGEKGVGMVSAIIELLCPDLFCQTKTLVEQYESGSRYFDIRVRHHKGTLVLSNGRWRSRHLYFALEDLVCKMQKYDHVYITITYEGKLADTEAKEALRDEVFDVVGEINDIWLNVNHSVSLWLMKICNIINDENNVVWETEHQQPVVRDFFVEDSDDFLMTEYL